MRSLFLMIFDLMFATWLAVNVSENPVPEFGIPVLVTVMLIGAWAFSSIRSSGVSEFVGSHWMLPSMFSGPRAITNGVWVPATIQYTWVERLNDTENSPMPA